MKKLVLIGLIGVLAVAVPATAKPSHPAKSHKCVPHEVSYEASGTLVSSALTKNTDGTYTGTLTVHVTRTNHHASADKGTDVAYALTAARVRFGHGVSNPPAMGDRVKVIGKVTSLAKKCDQTGFTRTVTVRRVVIHLPAKK
jgi:hypothetical protein